jgi:TolB-like protein/class 3 adenylate cyclase/Tfp pilus assembly protein PilF
LTGERVVRRLAAILAADVVGYSRLMGRDENGTLARLKLHRTERLEPILARHGGRLVKLTGDGALVEFSSAVDALSAAIEFQQAMTEANQNQPADTAIVFRIGLHLGDLIVDGEDLYGDGVNVAARLEAEAPPGGIVVSRAVREAVEGRLKAKLHALGELSLKNIERPIRAFRVEWEAADWKATEVPALLALRGEPTAPASTTPVLALPDKPSIAVLPFQNMSGDPEQEYFADGMVEDIITALSRTKALFVIARNSSFSYKGKSPDIRTVGRELGVAYVLEGSVRKAGSKVRITGQLIDAQSGAHVWAHRFDGELSDIFALQDEVATHVVMAIVPTLEQLEIQRSAAKPTESLAAYDCALRCWACIDQLTHESNQKALAFIERAIRLDPKFALARAMAAGCYVQRSVWRWSEDPERERTEALRLARTALELDRNDPRVLTLTGFALGYLGGLREESFALLEKATELDPNNFLAWHQLGYACLRLGKPAISHFERALRLNPRDVRAPFAVTGLASAHLYAGNFLKAAELAEGVCRQLPNYPPAMLTLIASYAHAGQIEKAKSIVHTLLKVKPDGRISTVVEQSSHPDYRRILEEGFRLAGMPE